MAQHFSRRRRRAAQTPQETLGSGQTTCQDPRTRWQPKTRGCVHHSATNPRSGSGVFIGTTPRLSAILHNALTSATADHRAGECLRPRAPATDVADSRTSGRAPRSRAGCPALSTARGPVGVRQEPFGPASSPRGTQAVRWSRLHPIRDCSESCQYPCRNCRVVETATCGFDTFDGFDEWLSRARFCAPVWGLGP